MERVTENSLSGPNTPFFVAISGHKEAVHGLFLPAVKGHLLRDERSRGTSPAAVRRTERALYEEANMDKLTGPQEHHKEF